MTGGSRIIDIRRRATGTAAEDGGSELPPEVEAEAAASELAYYAEDEPDLSPARDRAVAAFCLTLALGWSGFTLWTFWNTLGGRMPAPADIAALVGSLSAPLALIGVVYLLLMRTSRREARRFAATATTIRSESQWLESVLRTVTQRIDENRELLSHQSQQLMGIGEEAAGRMKVVSDAMHGEVESLGRQANALKTAATAARADMTVLLADLPKAQVQTRRMAEDLREAGLKAHENAGALEAQLSSLTVRGREADEIAGGAAQRLAAHLARMESTSDAAGARLEAAAGQMTEAVDAALSRAADAVDEARKGMEAQGAAMMAMVEQAQAALGQTGDEATRTLTARVSDINTRIEQLGQLLATHEAVSREMVTTLQTAFADAEQRLVSLDETGSERTGRLSDAISNLQGHAERMTEVLRRGGSVADTLIQKSESLLTALDANARELDETLPGALDRLDTKVSASKTLLSSVVPEAEKLEMTTLSAYNRLTEAEAVLVKQRKAIDKLVADMDRHITDRQKSVEELGKAIGLAGDEATRFAETAAPQLVESLVRVRETAVQASERAKETLASIVPETSAALGRASEEAMRETITAKVEAQMAEIAAAAARAVETANKASERLMSQMLTIADTTSNVEARIEQARTEIEEANRDTLSRKVALLIESLNSTSIDVAKILSNDVTDTAWAAYLKGDRGVFTRRAVRLLDAGEVREIARHYDEDAEFREQVNRYIHDFEAMLRHILSTRDGSPLGVTILSSDMGKLYVALAQAIERLRN